MIESLQNLWHSILAILGIFLIPDWTALVNLLPIFLFFGVVAPILTIIVLAWFIYVVRAPRPKVVFEEGPRPAPLDEDGRPVFPPGEPYCVRDSLIYEPGATRCQVCHDELLVICPKCGVGRVASVSTCGNCGLVLKIEPRLRALRPAGPRPGGAAIA
ncbi:MAG TPA: hypothetical protein VIM30_07635 [Candidatus Limnocylindrales bacterium]